MRRASLVAAVLLGLATLSPPVHQRADQLFTIHMLQHLVLVFCVAPLLVFATPRAPGWLRSIGVAVVLHAVALWAWHLPVLYDAAVNSAPLHIVEHGSFLATAWLFWGAVAARWAPGDPLRRAGAVFVTGLHSAALGAIITLASEPLYDAHLGHEHGWDLTPLEDQQLAGGIMWVPPGVVYLVITILLLGLWIKQSSGGDAQLQPHRGSRP